MAERICTVAAGATQLLQGDVYGFVPVTQPATDASYTYQEGPGTIPLIARAVSKPLGRAMRDVRISAGATTAITIVWSDNPDEAAALGGAPTFPGVSVTNFPATQAVTQSGAWTVGVNNFPATQAVTQSGTWNVNATAVGFTGTDPTLISNIGPAATAAMGATTIASPFKWILAYMVCVTSGSIAAGILVNFAIAAATFPKNTIAISTAGTFGFAISWGSSSPADISLPGPPPASANITVPAQAGLTSVQLISYKGF